MSMADRIPTMTDQDLASLHANAQRLESKGAPGQQKGAAEILPLIVAELAERQARKPKPVAKARKKAAPKAPKAAAAAS